MKREYYVFVEKDEDDLFVGEVPSLKSLLFTRYQLMANWPTLKSSEIARVSKRR